MTVGLGLTVTITATGVPGQLVAVGVMVYVAVPGVVPLFVNVWFKFKDELTPVPVPELLVAPVTPLMEVDHV